jgi:hypothetical protein
MTIFPIGWSSRAPMMSMAPKRWMSFWRLPDAHNKNKKKAKDFVVSSVSGRLFKVVAESGVDSSQWLFVGSR